MCIYVYTNKQIYKKRRSFAAEGTNEVVALLKRDGDENASCPSSRAGSALVVAERGFDPRTYGL